MDMCLIQDKLEEAENLKRQFLEITKRFSGETHSDTINTTERLESVYRYQEKWVKAEKLHLQILVARKTNFGETFPKVIKPMDRLALIYRG